MEYDPEIELYTAFDNFEQATNEDRLKNIQNMDTNQLADLLAEISGPGREATDWIRWLEEVI